MQFARCNASTLTLRRRAREKSVSPGCTLYTTQPKGGLQIGERGVGLARKVCDGEGVTAVEESVIGVAEPTSGSAVGDVIAPDAVGDFVGGGESVNKAVVEVG